MRINVAADSHAARLRLVGASSRTEERLKLATPRLICICTRVSLVVCRHTCSTSKPLDAEPSDVTAEEKGTIKDGVCLLSNLDFDPH